MCVFALTRQFQFNQLSNIISISLFLIFVFSVPFLFKNFFNSDKIIKRLFIFNIIFLTFLLIYSIYIEGNNISLAIRFYAIFILLLSVFFLPPKKVYINIFLILAVVQSVFLILFEIYILSFGGSDFAEYIRSKALSLELGDIYTYNNYFYRIQIKGNPILPIAFVLSLFTIKSKQTKFATASLILAGIIIAGNLAFLLSIVFFICMYLLFLFFSNKKVVNFFIYIYSNNRKRIVTIGIFVLIIMILSLILLYPYISEVLFLKMQFSIPARFDQAKYLLEDFSTSVTSLLFGRGLGNLISVITDFRDYRNSYYYELQSLYILNQVGILYFLIFLFTQIIFMIKFWRNKVIYLMYLSYVLYAFTNPYLFDTTNVLVLILLCSLSRTYFRKDNISESKI